MTEMSVVNEPQTAWDQLSNVFFLDSSENGYDSNLAISSVFFIIIESGIVI